MNTYKSIILDGITTLHLGLQRFPRILGQIQEHLQEFYVRCHSTDPSNIN